MTSPATDGPAGKCCSKLFIVVLLTIFGAFLFARAMDRDLNHDEHQFLAPGALLARQGLLPYRDYPLFHLPNLVFVYAAVDALPLGPIFGAKLCSVASTWFLAGLLVWLAHRFPPFGNPRWSSFASLGALLLLASDPLFLTTTGKTWNHELPTVLILAALCLQMACARSNRLWMCVTAGFLAGFAVGTRLTFAPALVPLCAVAFLFPVEMRRRWILVVCFTLSSLIALSPSLYFLATAQEPFIFGNFQFPRLRLLDPENTRIRKTMSWARKLRFFFKEVALLSWPLFAAYVIATAPRIADWVKNRASRDLPCVMLFSVLPFLLIGCFAPSRYQYQHYYAFIPLLVGGVIVALGSADRLYARRLVWQTGGLLAVALALVCHRGLRAGISSELSWIRNAGNPAEWFAVRAHKLGETIREQVPTGKVLTLAPAWPLEGGCGIYPEFASGPFAWRSAQWLESSRRPAFHMVAPSDLQSFLQSDPPAAILTGVEDSELEKPFVQYATERGYQPMKLNKKRLLWLPAKAKPALDSGASPPPPAPAHGGAPPNLPVESPTPR